MTDFRIEGLGIPELEWEWRASRIEDEMKRVAEELDKQVEEKQAERDDGAEPKARTEPATDDPAAADEDNAPAADETALETTDATADMSFEMTDAPNAETDASDTPVAAAGKHGREEDDDEEASSSAVEDNGAANQSAGGAVPATQKRSDHASKPKKVRIDDVDHESNLLAAGVTDDAAIALEAAEDKINAAEDTPAGEEAAKAEQADGIEVSATDPDVSTVATEQEDDVDGAPIETAEDATEKSSSPTKPSAAAAPPPPRENSRLRIYFTTPVSSSSSYVVPTSAAPDQEPRQSAAPEPAEAVKEEQPEDVTTAAVNDNPPEPEPTPGEVKAEEALADVSALEQVDDKLQEVVADSEPQDESAVDPVSETTNGAESVEAVLVASEGAIGVDAVRQEDSAADPAPDSGAAPRPEAGADNEEDGLVDGPSVEENDDDKTAEGGDKTVADANAPAAPRQASVAPSVAPSVAETISAPLPPEPAADRISIAYARNTRRMVLDAEVIEAVKIFRGEGRIELVVKCQPAVYGEPDHLLDDDFRVCKGVLVGSFIPVHTLAAAVELTSSPHGTARIPRCRGRRLHRRRPEHACARLGEPGRPAERDGGPR